MINIFSYDDDKYSPEQVRDMFDAIKEAIPKEDIIIAIPKNCDFYHNVSLEMLYYYRKMFDDLIIERQRSNMTKNDL